MLSFVFIIFFVIIANYLLEQFNRLINELMIFVRKQLLQKQPIKHQHMNDVHYSNEDLEDE